METEQAIRILDSKMQAPFRILATKKLKIFCVSSNHHNVMAKGQTYILKNINSKIEKENAMVAKVDRVKPTSSYTLANKTKKDHNFLNENKFQKFQKDPTDKYQKLVTKTLQHRDLIINKKQKNYLTQKKPQTPPPS